MANDVICLDALRLLMPRRRLPGDACKENLWQTYISQ